MAYKTMPKPSVIRAEALKIPDSVQPFIEWMNVEQLTCRQAAILLMVRANPGCTVGALALTLELQKPVVTRAADKLEDYLLIHRKPDPMDHRLVQLWPGRGPRKGNR